MMSDTGSCFGSIELRGWWLLLLLVGLSAPGRAWANDSGCNRARAIAAESQELASLTNPDYRAVLEKLKPAMRLCPGEGEIWRLAYCSALALGDSRDELYRKRATLGGVEALSCQGDSKSPGRVERPLEGYVRTKHALVVGIGSFADTRVPELSYTAKDARDFAHVLVEYAHFPARNVTVLTDAQATREGILSELQRLILTADEDDLVVLYVSSHGSPYQRSQGLRGIGYIVTHDTAIDRLWVDAIEYQDFAEKASLIRSRRLVIFLDTCFSGQAYERGSKQLVIEGSGIAQHTAEMFLSGTGTYVITSSRGDQRSWESDKLENSYFTHYLIEALRQGPEPPLVTEVFAYLSRKVVQDVAAEKGAAQHPQIHPKMGGGKVRLGVVPRLGPIP